MAKKSKGAVISAAQKAMAEWAGEHKDNVVLMDSAPQMVDVVPTGNSLIDWGALRIGGMPLGRIVEIMGPESSGKSTLCNMVLAQANKMGLPGLYVDCEHDFDQQYFEDLGGRRDLTLLAQPDSGDDAFDVGISALRKGWPKVMVFDSVAAMTPKLEVEGDMDVRDMGVHAKMMSKGLRKIRALASAAGTLVIFVNQIRNKVGVVFGSPETTTGGNALKFYASMRIDVRSVGRRTEKDEAYGADTRVRVVKNKLAPPFTEVVTPMIYGRGFSEGHALFELAVGNGIVKNEKQSWEVPNG